MTASAPIAGTLRTIPDAASAPPQDSGVPTHANFRSVLERYHESRESDAKSDDPKNSSDRKQQKDSDPTIPVAAPPAPEVPRLILPFTTSLTLRQDTTASPGDTAPKDTTTSSDDSAAIQDATTTAADQTTPSVTPIIFRSTIDLRSFHLSNATKTNSAPSDAQPKTAAKSPVKLEAKSTQDVPALADPSAAVLPVATTTTLDQAATAVKTSSTVDEAPDTAPVSTSTVDRGAFILADTRKAAYQYHSSQETEPATTGTSRPAPQPQQKEQKVSDATATIAVPVPVIEIAEPQHPLHSLPASNTAKHDAPAVQSSSAAAQDSLVPPASDSKTTVSPAIEQASDTTTAPPTGTLAFAAKLTPTDDAPASASTPAPDSTRPADSQSRVPTAAPVAPRQFAAEPDVQADNHSGDGGSQPDKENRFAKPEMVLPQTHAPSQDQSTVAAASHTSTSPLTAAARMDHVQEPPATAPSSNHDITIRIPDANTDQGTAVRFVERAGEVHVSVRTGDAEMAQTLRGGLNDLVNRLEDGGMRTQVWQPGADASTSQNDSHHPFADPDGSSGRQFSSGSNSEQESKQQNKPRWVEELEGSIGNPNFKETTQLLWQA